MARCEESFLIEILFMYCAKGAPLLLFSFVFFPHYLYPTQLETTPFLFTFLLSHNYDDLSIGSIAIPQLTSRPFLFKCNPRDLPPSHFLAIDKQGKLSRNSPPKVTLFIDISERTNFTHIHLKKEKNQNALLSSKKFEHGFLGLENID